MPLITLIRHAQASFGAADYDVLSDLGHRQSLALGRALARQGLGQAVLYAGAQRRHAETMAGLLRGLDRDGEVTRHAGLNEFDSRGLTAARFRDAPRPEGLNRDRRAHFRTLRETVLAWQAGEIADPPEPWAEFDARVAAARQAMVAEGRDVVAVSSGGAISLMVAQVMQAPPAQMMALQLQMKNCAVTRLAVTRSGRCVLAGFNETPHLDAETSAEMLTYS